MLCALFLGFVVSKKMGAQKKIGKSNRKKKELSRSSIRGSPLKYHYSQKTKEPIIHSSVPDPKKASKKEEARAWKETMTTKKVFLRR